MKQFQPFCSMVETKRGSHQAASFCRIKAKLFDDIELFNNSIVIAFKTYKINTFGKIA